MSTRPPPLAGRRRALMLGAVLLLSSAMLGLQVLQTVVLSLQVFPQVAFLVVSLAMLGLGSGGSVAALCTRWGVSSLSVMWLAALGFALSVVPVMAATAETHALPALIVLNALPFFFVGLFLALAFGAWPSRANQLYFFDLAGAGFGCLVIVGLLNGLGSASAAILVLAGIGAVAAILLGATLGPGRCLLAVAVLLALVPLIPRGAGLFAFTPPPEKFYSQLLARGEAGGHLERQRWSYLGRLDSFIPGPAIDEFEFARGTKALLDAGCDLRLLFSNGYNWSYVIDFARCPAEREHFLAQSPQHAPYLFTREPEVLNLGSGGGVDAYLARRHGARTITAIEINPLMIEAATRWYEHSWDDLWQQPNVSVHQLDARTYVATTDRRFDVITLNAVDAAGTQASLLSANFLYTTEAFARYLELLRPGGVLLLTRPREQLLRAITAAAAALGVRGASGPAHHFAVFGRGELLSATIYRDPLTVPQVEMIRREVSAGRLGGQLQYLPGTPLPANLFTRYFALLEHGGDDALPVRIDPATDDDPYFYQLEPRFLSSPAATELLTVLELVTSLGAILIFFPLFRLPLPGKARQLLPIFTYFVSIGIGFMLAEISLITKLSLLLGHPAYSVTVTLFGMLLFCGVGSMVAGRWVERGRTVGGLAFATIIPGLIVWALGTDALAYSGFTSIGARVGLALAWLAPVSFFLGMPLPLALRRLDGSLAALVPWAWAVNGVASVAGSVLALLLAMQLGFRAVLLAAAACYAVAALTSHTAAHSEGRQGV